MLSKKAIKKMNSYGDFFQGAIAFVAIVVQLIMILLYPAYLYTNPVYSIVAILVIYIVVTAYSVSCLLKKCRPPKTTIILIGKYEEAKKWKRFFTDIKTVMHSLIIIISTLLLFVSIVLVYCNNTSAEPDPIVENGYLDIKEKYWAWFGDVVCCSNRDSVFYVPIIKPKAGEKNLLCVLEVLVQVPCKGRSITVDSLGFECNGLIPFDKGGGWDTLDLKRNTILLKDTNLYVSPILFREKNFPLQPIRINPGQYHRFVLKLFGTKSGVYSVRGKIYLGNGGTVVVNDYKRWGGIKV